MNYIRISEAIITQDKQRRKTKSLDFTAFNRHLFVCLWLTGFDTLCQFTRSNAVSDAVKRAVKTALIYGHTAALFGYIKGSSSVLYKRLKSALVIN